MKMSKQYCDFKSYIYSFFKKNYICEFYGGREKKALKNIYDKDRNIYHKKII